MDEKSCKDCFCWVRVENQSYGTCRYNAPMVEGYEDGASFPYVGEDDWCLPGLRLMVKKNPLVEG